RGEGSDARTELSRASGGAAAIPQPGKSGASRPAAVQLDQRLPDGAIPASLRRHMSRSSTGARIFTPLAGAILSFSSIPAFAQDNLALHQPAISSGANWGSFTPASLTDGDTSTFVHPAAATGTFGFFYEVDLGHAYRLEKIVLNNRGDGCCPERLSNYRVEL